MLTPVLAIKHHQNAWLAFIDLQCFPAYIAVQQRVPAGTKYIARYLALHGSLLYKCPRADLKRSNDMTNFRIQNVPENSVNSFIAEAFNAATIALMGVVGILTLAATL